MDLAPQFDQMCIRDSCEAVRKSGNAALDESPCQAVVRAGSFGTPPYGVITEVFLTFATDQMCIRDRSCS